MTDKEKFARMIKRVKLLGRDAELLVKNAEQMREDLDNGWYPVELYNLPIDIFKIRDDRKSVYEITVLYDDGAWHNVFPVAFGEMICNIQCGKFYYRFRKRQKTEKPTMEDLADKYVSDLRFWKSPTLEEFKEAIRGAYLEGRKDERGEEK